MDRQLIGDTLPLPSCPSSIIRYSKFRISARKTILVKKIITSNVALFRKFQFIRGLK